jgi:hypothetical protein
MYIPFIDSMFAIVYSAVLLLPSTKGCHEIRAYAREDAFTIYPLYISVFEMIVRGL